MSIWLFNQELVSMARYLLILNVICVYTNEIRIHFFLVSYWY